MRIAKQKLMKFQINKRRANSFISFILLLLIMIFSFGLSGYRVNLTESMPIGIWKITEEDFKKGNVAIFYPPIIRNNEPLLKKIVAIEGDFITLTNDYIEVNGKRLINSKTYQNSNIPSFTRGTYQVKSDEVWLISEQHKRSYDSRYFGPIKKDQILAIMEPVWIYH